ncbi:hypothetical protein ALT721_210012 [Alteromonas alvinellae]
MGQAPVSTPINLNGISPGSRPLRFTTSHPVIDTKTAKSNEGMTHMRKGIFIYLCTSFDYLIVF